MIDADPDADADADAGPSEDNALAGVANGTETVVPSGSTLCAPSVITWAVHFEPSKYRCWNRPYGSGNHPVGCDIDPPFPKA